MADNEDIYQRMRELAHDYAEAEAKRVYLTEFRKSKKAILMKEAETANPGMSAAAQERDAYANQEYQDLLKGLEVATEVALRVKWELKVIETRFESWRTKNANKRAEMQMR
jgi:hypothetical protein